MKSIKMPAFIAPIAKAVKPAAIGLAVVGTGALAAQVGGAVIKAMSPQAEAFAAKSDWNEALVDAAGGVVLDTGVVAGIGAWKGAKAAVSAAPLLLIGTGASALARPTAHMFAKVVDKAVALVDRTPASANAGAAPAIPPSGMPFATPAMGLLPSPGGVGFGSPVANLSDYDNAFSRALGAQPPGGMGMFGDINPYNGGNRLG